MAENDWAWRTAMSQSLSWQEPARQYLALYGALLGAAKRTAASQGPGL
jgi:glycogen synthase